MEKSRFMQLTKMLAWKRLTFVCLVFNINIPRDAVRCGYFFVPGPNKRQNIYIVPHNYAVDCSASENDKKNVCIQLFDHLEGRLKMDNPSKLSGVDDSTKILGDDLCDLLGNKNIKKLPNRIWPQGIEVIEL